MKGLKNIFSSNQTPEPSKEGSKGEQTPGKKPGDVLFARLRRLEQRIDKIEAKVSTNQRDTWRIEKKLASVIEAPSIETEPVPTGLPKGFFDY